MFEYQNELWNKYTDDNEDKSQTNLSQFIYHTCIALGAKKICEAGCNVGNNLSLFNNELEVWGFDKNNYAIEKAIQKLPEINFKIEDINKTSFPDSHFDIVFTRGVFIHIPTSSVNAAMNELFRISKKWIFNLEYFGTDGEMIKWKRGDDLCWYRNMIEKWQNYDVELITDLELPRQIDDSHVRFTLIKKKHNNY